MRGLRLLDKLAHTAPLAACVDPAGDSHPELHHALAALDDVALAQLVRRRAETLYHPACSARMAPRADGGVVDPRLRVHGIPNLRVVDASIFPLEPLGNIQTTVYAVAEKAADIIKEDRRTGASEPRASALL